jgi:uncharacterized protein YfaS (alpha-2-macroglobulin family)
VKTRKTADPSEFATYITGYTTGVISKSEPVRIRLAKGNLKFEIGKDLPAGIFSFDPQVKGTATLYSEDIIVFKPSTAWPEGKNITATLDLSKILDIPDQFSIFNFQFSIIQPSFSIYPGNLISIGEKDRKMKKIEGKLVSADVMKLEEVEKLVEASSPESELKVKWAEGAGRNEFDFVIDSLPRLEASYQVRIKWDGSPLDISQSGEYTYDIPSILDFLYLGSSLGQGEEQYIDIILSDPVDPSQDLTGLIYLKEGDQVRLVADNNIIRVYPAARVEGEKTLVIENSLRNDARATLKERVEEKVLFEELKPAAEFIGQGVIMPNPEGLFLPVKTVNLRAVDVIVYKIFENNIPYYLQQNNFSGDDYYNFKQFGRPVYAKTVLLDEDKSRDLKRWNNFSLDLTPLMSSDPAAIYRVKLYFRKEYSLYTCDGNTGGDISKFILNGSLPEEKLEEWDSPSWYSEYEWPDDYTWRERENPCHNSYYVNEKFRQKMIMSSSIGVTAKSADGKHFIVITTDLVTGEPLPDVNVTFFNYQNQPVGSVKTGSEGQAEIALDNRPFFLNAAKEKQKTWLRVDDGSSLSLSNFDISGEQVQKGLKGMIYGERGVWRPGDTLFLTFILDDSQNKLPEAYPVQFDLTNSRGQLAYSTKNSSGENGFYTFKVPTDPEAPTGTWRAKVKVGGAFFEKNIKIETVKPNRLKIKLDFNQQVLNTFSQNPEGSLDVRWLHGAVAPGIRTEVTMSFRKSRTAFKGYEKYTFENPAAYFWAEERNVFNKELDNQGKARFSFELPSSENAPGMLDAIFLVRAFEKGGDFSTDVFTRQYTPFKTYIGINVPDGGTYRDMLETDKDHNVEVVSLDWQGNPVTSRNLEVKVYRVAWRWWWGSGEEDMAYYVGSQDAEIVYQGRVDAINGKGSFNLRVNYPEWGRYLILVKDPEGGHQAGLPVYFDWPSYVNRSGRANPAGATMLTFSADKEKYKPGENAVISFPATPGSRALVSVESGSRVLSSDWKICNKAEETFEIPITTGMAPNVYVYLSLIQPHQQTVNDMPIRMYGVIPLMIEDPATVLAPVIAMPDELKPEENFTVNVSERDGRPMTFTLAVVDDGLLDLTKFKTPDPHSVFYAREALGVKTWDMYDLVIGAYGGRLEKVLAIGGDDEATMAKNKKAQRFIPVVKYAGPYTLKKGEKKEISLHMPNYVGSVRTMVIAGNEGAYGQAEKTTPVRKALMVLATLPRVLGPGEEVELPVSVFAMDDKIKKVDVKIDTDPSFTVLSSAGQLTFTQAGEQMAYFNLKINEKVGIGKIKVTATSGNESAFQEFEVDIRNPNPVITQTKDYIIEPGQAVTIPYSYFGMEGTNNGKATFSGVPDFDLERQLVYLIRYPYGCLEQTVSSVFPQLYLSDLIDISRDRQMKIDRNIKAAINRISKLTLGDGSLSYWPGLTYTDNWATSYACQFLVLAQDKGYLLPSGLLDNMLQYQFKAAGNYRNDRDLNNAWRDVDQCYRLYTLALARKPNMSAMNRIRESGNLSATSAWILADAYLYAGKPEVAEELIMQRPAGVTDKYEYAGYTYGSSVRDMAYVLEVLSMLKKDTEAFRIMQEMAKELKNNYYSTQTSAFSLYAIAKYVGKTSGEGVNFELSAGNKAKETVNTARSVYQLELDNSATSGSILVKNIKTGSKLFLNIAISGQPVEGMETESNNGLKMRVIYKDDTGNPIEINSLKQGTDFIAEVTVEHAGLLFSFRNLALSQIFPSGWEIINTRVQEVNSGIREDNYDYRDYRDDRVYTFFSLNQYDKKTFRVRLNAAYTGRYYLPAVSCEAMYDKNVHANNKGRWVMVVR